MQHNTSSYIIDVNLPYLFSIWNNKNYIHQLDINPKASDKSIWEYAKGYNLTIITKDSDFSNRILISTPTPKVIHIKFGNLKMSEFHTQILLCWTDVLTLSANHKLVNVYKDKIEGIN